MYPVSETKTFMKITLLLSAVLSLTAPLLVKAEGSPSFSTEYDSVAGEYRGQIRPNPKNELDGEYAVEASLHTVLAMKAGDIIPQPALVGTIKLLNASQMVSFPIQGASFDQKSQRLAAAIQGPQGSTAIYFVCVKSSPASTHFDCQWQSVISDVKFDFTLDRL